MTENKEEKLSKLSKVSILGSMLFYFPGVAFRHHAIPALGELVTADIAKCIWNKTLEQQKGLALRRPQYSLGTNHLLRYMEWDCALYRAVREEGITESCAKELIEKINWAAFGPMNRTVFQISRLRSSHLLTRVKWIIDLMFLFIFTKPFQRHTYPHTNEVAFDVVVCPLAKYFKDQNISELTSSAACALDHQMANLWGLTFSRSQTIAEGYPLCDFRFYTKSVRSLTVIQPQTAKA